MSHFSVLVIGDNVDEQLAPYHEFECTGRDDQYVQNIDQLTEARKEYESQTSNMLRSPDGALYARHDDHFYRDPTPDEQAKIGIGGTGWEGGLSYHSRDWHDGRGYRSKVHYIPDGYEEVEVPTSSVESFSEFIEGWYGRKRVGPDETLDLDHTHKYGWYRVDANGEVTEVIKRTNPNRRWDWWVIGGRWGGFFLLKRDSEDRPILGRPSSFGTRGHAIDNRTTDQARKSEIDWEMMSARARQEALASYDQFLEEVAKEPSRFGMHDFIYGIKLKPEIQAEWDAMFANGKRPTDEERKAFGKARTVEDLESREEHANRRALRSGTTYAVVQNGEWYERGKMGWWGMASNEEDEDSWDKKYWEMIESLPDDVQLTVVDCHI